jgi:hypothetical protein
MGLGCGIRDPGSENPYPGFPDPDPKVKKSLDPGSGSATLFERMFLANYALFSLNWDQVLFTPNVQDEPRQGQH